MEELESNSAQEAQPEIKVTFDFSIQGEKERIVRTLKRHEWYEEHGYKPKYPEAIKQKLESEENISEEDILKAISSEFDKDEYVRKVSEIEKGWQNIQEKFFEDLKTLGLPLQEEYFVSATKYGTGGSYGWPNDIQLNLEQSRALELTLAHEIVHLTIDHLIKEFNIEQWTKERLVDLIMCEFFPEDRRLQRDPKNAEQISEIFEQKFPNIKEIISEVSKLDENI